MSVFSDKHGTQPCSDLARNGVSAVRFSVAHIAASLSGLLAECTLQRQIENAPRRCGMMERR